MKTKENNIEIIFTIQISPKEVKEFKIDESNLIKKFLSPKKREIGQKEYDLFVIFNGKAEQYFHKINSVSKKMNHFYGLPENIEEYFRLSKKYKVLCIEEKTENTRVELFRNINEQNNMESLEVEDKKLKDSVTRDKSICV
ncbi:hypothetical protein [Helicobacter rodentium]|uniref:hypothetical protein n=2 Tax=Helicobacter rodentium TaxID=59617 RepID=UPI0023EFAD69|nr:hypothetical protein [Helicobacter rodentium]